MRALTSIPRMYADSRGLKHGDLTQKLIGIFFGIHNELGHGFLECIYEQAFAVELADLLVDRKVIVELKTGRDIEPAWEKQLLNYLRATDVELGLLFNFGPNAQFRRYAFENVRKNRRHPRGSAEKKLPGSAP